MNTTRLVSEYIRAKGYSLKSIVIGTGLSETVIYPSLGRNSRRTLRVDEFFSICKFLQVDPMKFYVKGEEIVTEPEMAAS